jgi:hypothetical protein
MDAVLDATGCQATLHDRDLQWGAGMLPWHRVGEHGASLGRRGEADNAAPQIRWDDIQTPMEADTDVSERWRRASGKLRRDPYLRRRHCNLELVALASKLLSFSSRPLNDTRNLLSSESGLHVLRCVILQGWLQGCCSKEPARWKQHPRRASRTVETGTSRHALRVPIKSVYQSPVSIAAPVAGLT